MIERHINTIELITDIFRSIAEKCQEHIKLIYKTINKTNTKLSLHIKLTLILLLTLWLTSGTILTKIFSSVLLNTYFNTKWYLTVDSIQDILVSTKLSVAGSRLINTHLKAIKPEECHQLLVRAKRFEQKLTGSNDGEQDFLKLYRSEQLLSDINRGTAVMFAEDYSSEAIIRLNPWLRLAIAPDVYSPKYSTLFISVKHKFYLEIYVM